MNIETIHTETKKQLVPELRFKEFDDDWFKDRLINLTEMLRCGIAATPKYVEKGVPFLSAQNVTKAGEISLHKYSQISEEYYLELSKNHKLLKGDILYSRVGAGFGTAAIFPFEGNYGVYVSLTHIRSNFKMTNSFLKYYLNSELGKKQASNGVFQGGGVPNLNVKIVEKFKISFPTIPEQQKIASFLTAVDKKIQQLNKKAALLVQYKKGVMQQLFSGKLRFKDENGNAYPDWEEKRLRELIKLQGGNAFKSSQFKKEGIPIIRISNISNKTKYLDLEKLIHYDEQLKDTNYIIEQGDLLIAMSGATTGKSSISDFEGKAYLNQRVGLFKSIANELEYGFLIQFVFSDLFSYQLDGVLVTGAQPNISSKDIENFKLNFPCYEEQQKIASYLSNIDTKIESVQNQITQTQTFKKGLLQQLFV